MSRLNYEPYAIDAADSSSVLAPGDEHYVDDALSFGVESPGGAFIVGIGSDNPDVVFTGSRDDLVRLFRGILVKLGA